MTFEQTYFVKLKNILLLLLDCSLHHFRVCQKSNVIRIPFGFIFVRYLQHVFLQKLTDVSRLQMCSGLRVSCMYLVRMRFGSLECPSLLCWAGEIKLRLLAVQHGET